MARLLVVEDDQRIRSLLADHLAEAGHEVHTEGTALGGLQHLVAAPPDGALLDLGLPDLDGLELIRMIRSVSPVPILVLTAREDDPTIVSAFEAGADDYVTKPVSGAHLVARVAALLRRKADASTEGTLTVGALSIAPGPRTATLAGDALDLTPKEFDLLVVLAQEVGDVVRKDELYARVWREPGGSHGRTVDVHLSSLRKKLGETEDRKWLHTVHGVGVQMRDPDA